MVSSWGIPIVLVAQIYFLLHLRSLRQCLGIDVRTKLAPWIGVYDDHFARAIAVASAFVLPPATVAVVIAPEVTTTPMWVVALVTSGLLGLISFAILRNVWRALGNGR
jgi:chromate transport protein ChrA